MTGNNVRYGFSIRLAALALAALCLVQLNLRAQDLQPGTYIFTTTPDHVVGLAPGQSLRVHLANLIELEGREQNPVEIFARVRLYDAQSRVIAQSAEVTIPLNQFRSFNFNRAVLPFRGEPGTGRLQMRVSVEVRSVEPYLFIRDARATGLLPISLEIVDNGTGRTTVNVNGGQGRDIIFNQSHGASMIGIVHGQTLRLTVFNPNESDLGARLLIIQADGTYSESNEVYIPSGEFRSIDFNRASLHLAGEPGTGRVQVRAEARYRFFSIVDRTQTQPGNLPASLELVDDATGKTTVFKQSSAFFLRNSNTP